MVKKEGENMKNRFFFIMIIVLFLVIMINTGNAQIRGYNTLTGDCYYSSAGCSDHPDGNTLLCMWGYCEPCIESELCCCKPCPPEGEDCSIIEQCNPGERCTGFVCTNYHCCPTGEVWAGDGCVKLVVSPSSRDFGTVLVGSCSSTKNFEVTNTGTGTLTGNASVSAPFSCDSGCDYTLTGGQTETVKIEFCPTAEQSYSRTVSFSGGGGATATVTGQGTDPAVYYTLTVSKTGTGSGTVTGPGINCGTDCSEDYSEGTSVTLYASAATGSTFAGWSSACSGTGNCVVTMNSAKTVTATFNSTPAGPYTLTVTKTGTGSGTVTSSPAGINCGTDCSESYSSGTSVTLYASAASGSTFASWSGACSGTGNCIVTMNSGKSVTAIFTLTGGIYCGDGIIDAGETCDGLEWGGITGCNYFDEFTGGVLSCNPPGHEQECHFNTSLCTGGPGPGVCGDGVVNTGEECDGSDWGNIITGCGDFDEFTGGTLSCGGDCLFDTSLCTSFPPIECDLTSANWSSTEVIEGTTVGMNAQGNNCADEALSFNIYRGSTHITTIYEVFPSSSWKAEPTSSTLYYFIAKVVDNPSESATSNNLLVKSGIIPEYCDSIILCSHYEIESDCDSNICEIDVQDSVPNVDCSDPDITCRCIWEDNECKGSWTGGDGYCGDGVIDAGETCDGSNWGPITGCSDFNNFTGGSLSCVNCQFDTSSCTGGPGGYCGDGVIDAGETCDGSDWGPITGCTNFDYFTGGALSCGTDCQFDTSLCTGGTPGVCGDGEVNTGEQCDGSDWGPITGCTNFDIFTGGTLSCGIDCLFDTSQCIGGPGGYCGDGVVGAGETCDGSNWGPITGCTNFDIFTGGTLSCGANCLFDTSLCTAPGEDTEAGICVYTQYTDDNCDDGFLTFSWTAVWTWDPGCDAICQQENQNLTLQCVDGQKTVECPAQIPLPFFNIYSFIATLIIIVIIYVVMSSLKKKRLFGVRLGFI